MEILDQSTLDQLKELESNNRWGTYCLIISKLQAKARAKYYEKEEREISKKIEELNRK